MQILKRGRFVLKYCTELSVIKTVVQDDTGFGLMHVDGIEQKTVSDGSDKAQQAEAFAIGFGNGAGSCWPLQGCDKRVS